MIKVIIIIMLFVYSFGNYKIGNLVSIKKNSEQYSTSTASGSAGFIFLMGGGSYNSSSKSGTKLYYGAYIKTNKGIKFVKFNPELVYLLETDETPSVYWAGSYKLRNCGGYNIYYSGKVYYDKHGNLDEILLSFQSEIIIKIPKGSISKIYNIDINKKEE